MAWSRTGGRGLAVGVLGCLMACAGASAQVKISQVWSGGGSGASSGPAADVIELYNAGSAAQSLTGWSIQYSSRTSTTWTARALSGTIPAKGYFLIKLTSDSLGGGQLLDGVTHPTPDQSFTDSADSAGISSSGKAALVNSTAALTGACPSVGVIDLVGWSFSSTLLPNCSEGAAAVPASDVSSVPAKALRRKCEGLLDTGSNANDFEQYGPIALRNSSAPTNNGITVRVQSPFGDSAPPGGTILFQADGTDCAGVAAGTSATADLSPIGLAANQPLTQDSPGVFSFSGTVGTGVTPGIKTILVRIDGPGGTFGNRRYLFTVAVPNDECFGATPIAGAGPFAWNNAGATTSVNQQLFMGCDLGSSMSGGIEKDLWFVWTAPTSEAYTVSTAGTTPAGHDSLIAVYDNACPPGSPLACNDDGPGVGPRSTLSFSAIQGQSYLIQVGSAAGSFTTTGQLSIAAGDSGACCLPNFAGCVASTGVDCASQGGLYRGPGSTCVNANCPEPTGVCCTSNGGCTVTTQGVCNVSNGISWDGASQTCSPSSCPPGGKCCVGNACSYLVQSACLDIGGIWTEDPDGSVCSAANPCGGSGVICCRGTTCLVVASIACVVPSGTGFQAVQAGQGSCNGAGVNTTPCCYADFSKDGTRNLDDIFIYLNAWFGPTTNPYTKIGGDTQANATIDDLFIFLNIWFAGGCG